MATAVVARQKIRFDYLAPLREARGVLIDEPSRTARVVIMTEGLGNLRDRNFYTKDAVKTAAEVFNGRQFFVDHPSSREEEERPERSVRDLAGYFYDTELGKVRDPDTGEQLEACFAKLKFADSEPGRLAFDQMKEALEYQRRFPESKDVYAGISINGGGVSHPATIRGMEVNMVTEIQEAFSADIVTKPARGGRFVGLLREASRLAAWRRRHARESRGKGREAMATVTTHPKVRKQGAQLLLVKEARRAYRDLTAAIEAKKGEQVQASVKKLAEAFKALVKSDNAELKKAAESATGKMGKLTKLVEQGDDPATMVSDIKSDVDALYDALIGDEEGGGGEGEGGGRAGEGEGEGEGEEEGEGEGEGEGEEEGEEEGEDEDDELGMGSEDEDGMMPRAMQYSCSSCGETNRVMPPKGFRLARMGESEKGADGLEATVRRLRRTLESKETRFVRHNREHQRLVKENIQMRARLLAQDRLEEARKALKEAGIPPDIMKPKELLPFEPEQWPAMIGMAKRQKAKEAAPLNRGGAGPRGGSGGGDGGGEGKDAKSTFKEAYKKPHDIVG